MSTKKSITYHTVGDEFMHIYYDYSDGRVHVQYDNNSTAVEFTLSATLSEKVNKEFNDKLFGR